MHKTTVWATHVPNPVPGNKHRHTTKFIVVYPVLTDSCGAPTAFSSICLKLAYLIYSSIQIVSQ